MKTNRNKTVEDLPEVTVIIPTLNEEDTIFQLAKNFKETKTDFAVKVLVIDGHSTDATVEWAKKAGVDVMVQKTKGKGMAMVEAVEASHGSSVCVFVDGDGTYLSCDLEKIVEPVLNGHADMVVGSRLEGKLEKGAIEPVNSLGNRLYNLIVRLVYRKHVTDMLSGYRAIRTDAFKNLNLKGRHFEVEVEMTIKSLAKDLRVAEVPITYLRRKSKTTKLRPFRDGTLIFKALISEILNSRKA
jgi:dolichol-phosphate mannosyltransferase